MLVGLPVEILQGIVETYAEACVARGAGGALLPWLGGPPHSALRPASAPASAPATAPAAALSLLRDLACRALYSHVTLARGKIYLRGDPCPLGGAGHGDDARLGPFWHGVQRIGVLVVEDADGVPPARIDALLLSAHTIEVSLQVLAQVPYATARKIAPRVVRIGEWGGAWEALAAQYDAEGALRVVHGSRKLAPVRGARLVPLGSLSASSVVSGSAGSAGSAGSGAAVALLPSRSLRRVLDLFERSSLATLKYVSLPWNPSEGTSLHERLMALAIARGCRLVFDIDLNSARLTDMSIPAGVPWDARARVDFARPVTLSSNSSMKLTSLECKNACTAMASYGHLYWTVETLRIDNAVQPLDSHFFASFTSLQILVLSNLDLTALNLPLPKLRQVTLDGCTAATPAFSRALAACTPLSLVLTNCTIPLAALPPTLSALEISSCSALGEALAQKVLAVRLAVLTLSARDQWWTALGEMRVDRVRVRNPTLGFLGYRALLARVFPSATIELLP